MTFNSIHFNFKFNFNFYFISIHSTQPILSPVSRSPSLSNSKQQPTATNSNMTLSQAVSAFFVLVAVIFCIIALATPYWLVFKETGTETDEGIFVGRKTFVSLILNLSDPPSFFFRFVFFVLLLSCCCASQWWGEGRPNAIQ